MRRVRTSLRIMTVAAAGAALGAGATAVGAAKIAGGEARGDRAPAPEVYIIRDGDTLWDVSGRFFGDPFYWPKLWEQNDYIANPHQIVPGDRIFLRPGPGRRTRTVLQQRAIGAELPPTDFLPVEAAPSVRARGRTYYFPEARHAGMIAPEDLEGFGYVVGSDIDRNYWDVPNPIFVTFPPSQDVAVGDRFVVYVPGRDVFEPGGGKLGVFMRISGVVEITQFVEPGAYKAQVVEALGEIHIGCRLQPFVPRVTEITVKDSPLEMEGRIVILDSELRFAGQHDIVYIDLGVADGVEVGNRFTVFRPGQSVYNPESEHHVKFPEIRVGELVVIRAEDRTAAGLVTYAVDYFERRDLVRLAK